MPVVKYGERRAGVCAFLCISIVTTETSYISVDDCFAAFSVNRNHPHHCLRQLAIARRIPERTARLSHKTPQSGATDSVCVVRRTASSARRPVTRPCAHARFRDPLPKFYAYRRILHLLRYTTAAGESDRRSANSATAGQSPTHVRAAW